MKVSILMCRSAMLQPGLQGRMFYIIICFSFNSVILVAIEIDWPFSYYELGRCNTNREMFAVCPRRKVPQMRTLLLSEILEI